MKIKPDCISCILRVSISAIRQSFTDESMIRELFSDFFDIPSLRGMNWDITCPEIFEQLIKRINNAADDNDPFQSLKVHQNKKGLEFYPQLQNLVCQADDPIFEAIKLAIIGNSLDIIMSGGSTQVERMVLEKIRLPIPEDRLLALKKKLETSKLLLYFADNSGEIVFDKLLIETLKAETDIEVVFVVRSVPTLNDATCEEAKMIGIDQVVTVIENGINGPLPGTILSRCSPEVQTLFHRSDFIISKGGGNFDTLSEETHPGSPITYLLMCKCIPYSNFFRTKLHHPIIANVRIPPNDK